MKVHFFCIPLRRISLAALFAISVIGAQASASHAQGSQLTFAERVKAKFAILKELDPRALDKEQLVKIADALLSGVDYGNQAKVDEEAGYELAHQKAAYNWGYSVGDPKTVRLARLYWEGVQLGVFAFGDLQQQTGEKSARWAAIESMVGGNGEEYDVDEAYIEDIFADVEVAADGATAAQNGEPSDFVSYAERFGK